MTVSFDLPEDFIGLGFAPAQAELLATLFNSKVDDITNVTLFGAQADLKFLMSPIMTAGSAILTDSGAAFTPRDVGKVMAVTGAGVGGDGLLSTIASIQSATRCTLANIASTTVGIGAGVPYFFNGATVQGTAKGYYGTDDTAAIQAAINALHPTYGVVTIPEGGCLVLGTLYVQTSSDVSASGLIWRRLVIQGVSTPIQSGLNGNPSPTDSNLFKPTSGDLIRVNLDANGRSVIGDRQYYEFGMQGIALYGLAGTTLYTTGINLFRVRAKIWDCTFNNLLCGWNGLDADADAVENYCDQWNVNRVRFNASARLFAQRNADASFFDNIQAESFHPSVTSAISMIGGRGWQIRAPLINQVPSTGVVGDFSQLKEGLVTAGHFEHIYGTAFSVTGSNSNTWVDIQDCDFFNPDVTGVSLTTISYVGASGEVSGCGFSHNRTSGVDINFSAGRWQEETRNQFFTEDNVTRRFPSVNITVSSGTGATSFHQQYFVEVLYNGVNFDIRSVNGNSVLSQIFSGNPSFSTITGRLNLDGSARWGRPLKAIVQQKDGKYRPVLVDVQALGVVFYDDAGVKVLAADTNMDFYLEVS